MIGSSTRKDEALDRLIDGIAQLTSADMWRSWLTMQARFHKYSFSNTVLILAQRPTATRVTGFRTWRQLGRHVQRGQRAIWILAPVVTRRADDRPDATDLERPTRTVVAFRAVPVFAEDQTSGEPLPEVCRRLSGEDPHGLYEALVQVARDVGFSVADHAFDGETNGDCSPQLHQIRIEERLAPAHRAKTDCGPNPVGTGSGGAGSVRPGEPRGALSSASGLNTRLERRDVAGVRRSDQRRRLDTVHRSAHPKPEPR
jgi:hypothetical protein